MHLTKNEIAERLTQHTPKAILNHSEKHAAVLFPIVKYDNSLHLLFTKRTDTVEHHKGQISFPGGACDDADDSLVATALRETEEEIGLPRTAIEILGTLDDISIPTGFVVTPIVGFVEQLPSLATNCDEVAEIIFIPLEDFFDGSKCRSEMRELKGKLRHIYLYDVWREPVWGATAVIIKQFTDLFDMK